jgi:hypothetical protein
MAYSPSAYVPGAIVEFKVRANGAAVWTATINRGAGSLNRYRAYVPSADGPDAAVTAVVDRFNSVNDSTWIVLGPALSLDGGNRYAYPVGPAYLNRDGATLDAVAALLSATQWSTDHTEEVAELVRATGRTIADLGDQA